MIYNAVDPERLNSGDASSLRRQLGIGQDEIVIVAVASLIHRKGYDLLLAAFMRVRRVRPGTRLVIVGDGPDRAHSRRWRRTSASSMPWASSARGRTRARSCGMLPILRCLRHGTNAFRSRSSKRLLRASGRGVRHRAASRGGRRW